MEDFKCECDGACHADIDWNKDNGYGYVLEELKATRAHIDSIIKTIEMRIEKDAIIDEVLNTDYPDEVEDDTKTNVDSTLDALFKAIAIQNAMNEINQHNNYIYPNRLRTWF